MTERCGEILQQNRKSKSLHLADSALAQLEAKIETVQSSLDGKLCTIVIVYSVVCILIV